MSNYSKEIDQSVQELKNLGKILIPYNYPKTKLGNEEDDLLVFKTRLFVVDGYSLVAHYQRCEYDDYYLDILQIYGDYSTFLPLPVICKLAKKFLGNKELSLVEAYKDNRKIYCWTLYLNKKEEVIPSPHLKDEEWKHGSYDDMQYFYVPPNKVFFI